MSTTKQNLEKMIDKLDQNANDSDTTPEQSLWLLKTKNDVKTMINNIDNDAKAASQLSNAGVN